MTPATPPADATSLLVPIHLDAWTVGAGNQELTTWYEADYRNLESFESPIETDNGTKPPKGIHLHWALPDALTHGHKADAASTLELPLVPNCWLVARFGSTAAASRPGSCRATRSPPPERTEAALSSTRRNPARWPSPPAAAPLSRCTK